MKVITGTWVLASGAPVANGRAFFKLSQDAVAIGSNQVAPSLVSFNLDANGNIPSNSQLWANDELTPSGTTYSVSVLTSGGALVWGAENILISGTSPVNLNNAVASVQNVTLVNPVLQNPTGPQTITGFGLTLTNTAPLTVNGGTLNGSYAGNPTFSGSVSIGSALSAQRLFGVCFVDGVNEYLTLSAAVADANCKTAYIVPGTTTTEPSLTFTRNFSVFSPGTATLNYGSNTITVNPGVNSVGFVSAAAPNHNVAANNFRLVYTGNSTFITVGSSASDTSGFQLINTYIDGFGAGNASVLVDLIRTQFYKIDTCNFNGNAAAGTAQIGLKLDGTSGGASFTGYGQVLNSRFASVNIGIQGTGSGVGAANANFLELYTPGLSGTNPILVDLEAGSSQNEIHIQDCTGVNTCFNAGGSNTGNYIWLRDEGITVDAAFSASSCGNTLYMLVGTTSVTDPSFCNSVQTPVFGVYTFGSSGSTSGQVQIINDFHSGGLGGIGTKNNFSFNLIQNGIRYWQLNTSGNLTAVTDNQNDIGAAGANRPRNIFVAGSYFLQNALLFNTAPTISSGFGTSPSITPTNGTGAFRITVGNPAAASGVIGLPTATNGWNCYCTDITTNSTSVSSCKQTASATNSATIGNFSDVSVSTNWVAGDVLAVSCFAV